MQVAVEGGRARPVSTGRGTGGLDVLARLLFVAAIVGLAFGYGYVARGWKLFPHA